jgi:hypothetical protein
MILIGNGFDLAHGLKSSNKDFVLDLLNQKINQAIQDGVKKKFEYSRKKNV